MAPSKTAKRAGAADVVASSPKKQRVDPKFEGIIATLQNADYLNDHCRAMLIAFTASLKTPQSVRHPAQIAGVTMIEETLQDARKKFADAAAVTGAKRSSLEGTKETCTARMQAAETSLQEKQAAANTAQSAFDGAQEAVKTAHALLVTAKEAQFEGEKPFVALGEEKAALTTAFAEHFQAPMEAGQGPHFNFLERFTENLGLEESLIKALPSSCIKTKDQRGGFDDLVIAEFEKALVKKIAALEKAIVDEVPAASQRKHAVVAAEASVASKVAEEEAAAAKLASVSAVREKAEEQLCQAKEECVALEPTLEEVVLEHDSLVAELNEFENGTLANFESLRDKSVEGEAATAGA